MNESTTTTFDGEDVDDHVSRERFSFIRAAAGFVLADAPESGVFTGPATERSSPVETAGVETAAVDPVERPQPAPMAAPKPPKTPLAHRLMVFALLPFVIIAVSGLFVINRPSPRRQQPAPAPKAATVTSTPAPTTSVESPVAPDTTLPQVNTSPAPPEPTVRAPREPRVAPATANTVTPTTATTPSTEAPAATTEEPATATTQPPTTTTTQPPTTTTTQPPTSTTTQPSNTPLTEQP